ncbi:ISL3 family transposase [Staphylococcus simulans]|uniref:ISL3 family transposase n=1 Tax=Staphylococcus simulans TaxID=1286 RepID=UPI0021D43AFA|nr:ISL3 family transposase [Staphylococcus simulans]UXR34039.1 ISL3 family transposase [Staphylococcus simulans]
MCNDILKLLKIKDENIKVMKVEEDVEVRGQLSTVVYGTLSYKPEACMKCGCVNDGQIHKHGKRVSRLTLLKSQESNVYLNLAKERFKCLHCSKTFTAQTSIVDSHCFITNRVKLAIQHRLTRVQSELDIANDCSVSPSTVKRYLHKLSQSLTVKPSSGLPRHISIDEFKSVKNVTTAMSFLFVNNETNQIIDILEDRRIHKLKEYFYRFDRRERLAVRTVTADMYEPYINFVHEVFPNAILIFDRFHIVQHLNRELNKQRISVMNAYRYKSSTDYTKLKKHWRLFLSDRQDINSYEYFWSKSFKTYTTSRDILGYLLNLDQQLYDTYMLVHQLREALKQCDWLRFTEILRGVEKKQVSRGVWRVIRFYKKYEYVLYATIQHPMFNNGAIEGINNKIKLIKRVSYGYRNFNNFKARILIIFKLYQRRKKHGLLINDVA